MSCFSDGDARSMMLEVMDAKERSKSESASSTTRCVTWLSMLGSFSAMLPTRCGVETKISMPLGLKRRLRMTVGLCVDEIGADLYFTVWDMDLTTLPT